MRIFTLLLAVLMLTDLSAQQWIMAEGPFTPQRIDDITFVNNDLAFAAGGGDHVYRSTDGGVSWNIVFSAPSDFYFRSIDFLDESTGFVTSLNGQILTTTDGGDSWENIDDKIPGENIEICGLDHQGDTIWGVGVFANPATMIRSFDRGESWSVTQLDSLADGLVEVYFQDANTGFIGGISEEEGAKILRTDDGGDNWITVFTSEFAFEFVWKIFPVDQDTLYASIENLFAPRTSIACSYDGGATWSEKFIDSLLFDIQGIGFLDGQTGWVSPRNVGGLVTNDGGQTWDSNSSLPPNINRITARPDGTLFASGSGIHYYAEDTLISSTVAFPDPAPVSTLSVFPNPVGKSFNYHVKVDEATNYRIDLVDTSGKPLANLGSGRLLQGVHDATYHFPANFPPGPLFMVLRCDDHMMSVKIIRE